MNPSQLPRQGIGEILALQLSQQNASLIEENRRLSERLAVASSSIAAQPPTVRNPDEGLSLRTFCRKRYLRGKNHADTSATAELAFAAIDKLEESLGHVAMLAEIGPAAIDAFRDWLEEGAEQKRFRPATANKYLRHLRAVINYAVRKRLLPERMPPIDFLKEERAAVKAWTVDELAAIERQARALKGTMPGSSIPAATWWTAWHFCMACMGCRITAMMLAERIDFCSGSFLLRAENQKQRQNQRIELARPARDALRKLLDCHAEIKIFPWPFDPPPRKGNRKWKVLAGHFRRQLLAPAGLAIDKGNVFRQYRRTVATLKMERGESAQELLGHSSRATTKEFYEERGKRPPCKGLALESAQLSFAF